MTKIKQKSQKLWRSIDDVENSPEFLEKLTKEFPSGADELEIKPGIERRKFLELIGSSMALAGIMTTGCIRKPKEYIYPENNRPENTLPGEAKFYSTSACIGSGVLGLSVTSTDGRPTKIDGNSLHPMNNPISQSNLGSSNAFAQAEILNLYDSDRGQIGRSNQKQSNKNDILEILKGLLHKSDGKDTALLIESMASPSYYHLLSQLKAKYPKISFFEHNTLYTQNRVQGVSQLVGQNADVFYDISKADIILSLDADFLGVEGDTVKNAREFALNRKRVDEHKTMNRLYCIESNLSITGSNADHRYALNSFKIAHALVALVNALNPFNLPILQDIVAMPLLTLEPRLLKWIAAVAKDIIHNKHRALIIVGAKQPPWMHAFGLIMNKAIGALNRSVHVIKRFTPEWFKDPKLIQTAYEKKTLNTLIMIGGNPVYSLPADLNFKDIVQNVQNSFYLGYYDDETAHSATHYIPQTHFLESWGDTFANDGTYAIRQPLIEPLFEECMNEYEFISSLLPNTQTDYQIVLSFCKDFIANQNLQTSSKNLIFDNAWRTYLSSGIVGSANVLLTDLPDFDLEFLAKSYRQHSETFQPTGQASNIEIVFALSNTLYDGRYANNAWLQELPDPLSKLVWDNALFVSPMTARRLGFSGNPKPGRSTVGMVTIQYENRSLDIPIWEVPGIAEGSGILNLGFGSKLGQVSKESGFNVNKIRTSHNWFGINAQIQKNHHTYSLVTTQEHGSMIGDPTQTHEHRTPAVRTASLSEYLQDPDFVLKDEVLPLSEQKSFLFNFPKDPDQSKWARQQWGMSIDLNSCIGCNACTVACQAENNISVVGKERVFKSRIMNWIRIDRYFSGNLNNPEVQTLFQPMNCQHCENAPCEAVCPVAATSHSPDGLNDMTYNRCVGTRYCANNCPYKVRRYNFFNYSEENDKKNQLYAMQKNPNVTVRFRGVMEKCTYCVQKINTAKNKANGHQIPDGGIITACQSVCPTNAIVFGDVADPMSSVSKLKSLPRNYGVLGELNTRPRTTYLAKIRNINPEIG